MSESGTRNTPRVRLVEPSPAASRSWDGAVGALFPGDARLPVTGAPWTVLGGPGTGKSALLVDLAVAYINAGVPADEILVVAPAKDAAARLRADIAARLVRDNAGKAPAVRAVHSHAFAVVRAARVLRGETEPQLMPGARQDAWVRTLLAGEEEDGGDVWPERLRPALGMVGFARQVRDIMLRAQERGISADGLVRLGQQHSVPEWVAVGQFMQRYAQAVRLLGSEDVNAAELTGAAIAELDADDDVAEQFRHRVLLVDDGQQYDPQAGRFIDRLAHPNGTTIITGDADQAVLGFRGATTEFLNSHITADRSIELRKSFRCPPPVAYAGNAIAQQLPGTGHRHGLRGRDERSADQAIAPRVDIAVFDTGTGENNAIANALRRAHATDGVPWSEMAVLLRAGATESSLHRTLARAGVPVHIDPTDIVLREQRMVAALMLAMRALTGALTEAQWEELLMGPLGEADPITLTRLRRGVRRHAPEQRAMDRIVELLASAELTESDEKLLASLGPRERLVLERPLQVLQAGRAAIPQGVEMVLWAMWEKSGLDDHLVAESLRGGASGAAADRDLDAVLTLFDFAGDLIEDLPNMGLDAFIAAVSEQELPTGVRDRRGATREAVSVLSAHAAAGRSFQVVVVAGVQEDTWPTTSRTGSIVRQQELIDLVDKGIVPGTLVSQIADRVAEERRLFYLAITRASQRVLVTAVNSPDEEGEPSRFITELAAAIDTDTSSTGSEPAPLDSDDEIVLPEPPPAQRMPRLLSETALTAELRAALVGSTPALRRRAATQLARLAADGVPGARPEQWWGMAPVSTDEPVHTGPVRLGPSRFGDILDCPLKALLQPNAHGLALSMGSVFHRVAQALDEGVGLAEAAEELRDVIHRLVDEPPWAVQNTENEWCTALQTWADWSAAADVVGTEVRVDVPITEDVVIAGRIDRLHKDDEGYTIVDIKTGKHPVPIKGEHGVENNPQLGAYQLALHYGQLSGRGVVSGSGMPVRAAQLVYPRQATSAGQPTVRSQTQLTPDGVQQWRARAVQVAADSRGPTALATPGPQCATCPVRRACPAQEAQL
ncbi:ATP-dependent helicase [Corynebacterium sp. TAE3-ERU12]|uniref:ATP-dependent helicase n=1 Tax=Corynebacterium sp. TAE3-ERU12 TaxID=2849491 RepID=UPI001C486F46|nr:ATP-dependent DNA helicase [Corynebacterium sp. TAE3-ERU12]MBV7294842.1 ATP-dependent helicase [Corynebacterium sp. TAE3-ERU12]